MKRKRKHPDITHIGMMFLSADSVSDWAKRGHGAYFKRIFDHITFVSVPFKEKYPRSFGFGL